MHDASREVRGLQAELSGGSPRQQSSADGGPGGYRVERQLSLPRHERVVESMESTDASYGQRLDGNGGL